MFNLDKVSTISITAPTTGIFSLATANPIANTPYGQFTNGIDYTAGNGSSTSTANDANSLGFKVTNTSGISFADFITSTSYKGASGGYYFSADVIGPNGGTGNIASNSMSPVPEPKPFAMMLAGFGLLGFIAARRKSV